MAWLYHNTKDAVNEFSKKYNCDLTLAEEYLKVVRGIRNQQPFYVTDEDGEETGEDTIEIGLLHGQMKPAQKNDVMERFAANEIQVLVSTTVVEVGVNVPNATVMMIENAEHFGLAQLHQLRGRVGRGDAQSYCIMVNCSNSKESQKRLDILNQSNDGFKIASEDLKLRGPGDFFGIRQSGEMQFALADIYQDAYIMQRASEEVADILGKDPELSSEDHKNLKDYLELFLADQRNKLNL